MLNLYNKREYIKRNLPLFNILYKFLLFFFLLIFYSFSFILKFHSKLFFLRSFLIILNFFTYFFLHLFAFGINIFNRFIKTKIPLISPMNKKLMSGIIK